VLVGYASLAPVLVADARRAPWWLPGQALIVVAGALLVVRVVTYLAGDPLDSAPLLWKVSLASQVVTQGVLAGVAYLLQHRSDDGHVEAEVFTTSFDGD